MTKNKPIIENFLSFKGLPAAITLLSILIGMIVYIVNFQNRIGIIERDHQIFAEHYQKQIDDIKNSQIRLEQKFDRLFEQR